MPPRNQLQPAMKLKPYKRLHSNGEVERGYCFYCPACRDRHWLRTVAVSGLREDGSPWPLWKFNGDTECPTFSPSLLYHTTPGHYQGQRWVQTGPKAVQCHSLITEGKITFFEDNPHSMAGQVVELPDLPEEVLH